MARRLNHLEWLTTWIARQNVEYILREAIRYSFIPELDQSVEVWKSTMASSGNLESTDWVEARL